MNKYVNIYRFYAFEQKIYNLRVEKMKLKLLFKNDFMSELGSQSPAMILSLGEFLSH